MTTHIFASFNSSHVSRSRRSKLVEFLATFLVFSIFVHNFSEKKQLFAKTMTFIQNLFCTLNATLRDLSGKLSCSRSRHFPTKWQRIKDLTFHVFSKSHRISIFAYFQHFIDFCRTKNKFSPRFITFIQNLFCRRGTTLRDV